MKLLPGLAENRDQAMRSSYRETVTALACHFNCQIFLSNFVTIILFINFLFSLKMVLEKEEKN